MPGMAETVPDDAEKAALMRPLYELSVEGCDPVVVTAEALFEAWAESAPDGVARACNLQLGQHVTVCEVPRVVVQRIR